MELKDIVEAVKSVRDDSRTYKPEDITAPGTDSPSIDIRLQVYSDGEWAFHSGDQSFDQDHRGYWGASSVGPEDDDATCEDIAKGLIDQVAEDAAGADDQSIVVLMDGIR